MPELPTYDAHEGDIIIHKAAKKAFDELALKKLPTVNLLQAEYSDLLVQKKLDYAALAKARATGKPVFVYFTADWCLSCKANEAGAINREAVQDAFDKAGVVTLVGDWTNGDPAITRALAEHGRNSVPLYLWYAPGKAEAEILPQILTPGLLTDKAGAI